MQTCVLILVCTQELQGCSMSTIGTPQSRGGLGVIFFTVVVLIKHSAITSGLFSEQ